MKYSFRILHSVIGLMLFAFVGCNLISGSSAGKYVVDQREFAAADTVTLANHNGNKLILITDVNLIVPVVDMDNEKLAALYNVYCSFLLDADSLSGHYTPQALPSKVIACLQNRYAGVEAGEYSNNDTIYRSDDILKVNCDFNANLTYNNHGIVSMHKVIMTGIGDDETVTEGSYLNYDIAHEKVIDNTALFGEENLDVIVSLIREQLMRNNDARTEQQLIDLGFFNLDNISLSNNFTFTSNGIMWVYRPLEVGCYALGDVSVELPFSDLSPYVVSEEIDLSEL